MSTDEVRSPSARPRVLLVDDHRLFAEVLAARLALDPAVGVVEHAPSLSVARACLGRFRPDVVLLDHDLGGVCGLDLMPDLKQVDPVPRVVVLSASSRTETIVSSLRAGADGWVPKDSGIGGLVDAIGAAWGGQLTLPATHWEAVVRGLLPDPAPEGRAGRLRGLTDRQHDVLRCLVSGMTQREAADALYLSPHTVHTHVQVMFRHLGVRSTPSLVALARECGVTVPA